MSDHENQDDPQIEDIVKEVKKELDPHGAGYHTDEAANLIFYRVKQACGYLSAAGSALMRKGAVVALKEYVGRFSDEPDPSRRDAEKAATAAIIQGQGDFAVVAPGFEWLWRDISLSESHGSVRKLYGQLTFPEATAVYDMLLKKGNETLASARRVKTVLDAHPDWQDNPTWSMSKILGIKPPRR